MLEKFLSETTLDVKEAINLGLFLLLSEILWAFCGLKMG